MSALYATGPVDIWCGVGGNGDPLFLGHGTSAPRIEVHPNYIDWHSDRGGKKWPAFRIYDGQVGQVTVDLVRYRGSTLQLIQDRAAPTAPSPDRPNRGEDPGLDWFGKIGTVMEVEGATYALWLRFPFSSKPAFRRALTGAMPAGYRFPAAMLTGPEVLTVGTGTAKVHRLTWYCSREEEDDFTDPDDEGGLRCYDHDLSALPPIPPDMDAPPPPQRPVPPVHNFAG